LPKVSVIAGAHNQHQHVHQSVQSVLAQTYQDLELIITDDASEDDTPKIIDLFSGDKRLKILSNKARQGFASAINRAGSVSQGEYIAWLNCDDILERHHLETLVTHLENNPSIDGVFGQASIIDEDGAPIGLWADDVVNNRSELLNALYHGALPLCLSTGLVKTNVVMECGHMPATFSRHFVAGFLTNVLFKANVEVIPDAVTRSRKSEKTESSESFNRGAFEKFELQKIFLERITNAAQLLEIFPEVSEINLPVTDELVQFHLALIGLSSNDPGIKLFGLDLLHSQLRDADLAKHLKAECGFTPQDLFDFAGGASIFLPEGYALAADGTVEKPERALSVGGTGRLKLDPELPVRYDHVLPGWVAESGISPREGPHPETGIPFAFHWCDGPVSVLRLTVDRSGPHLLVLDVQNLLFDSLKVSVGIGQEILASFDVPYHSGARTDIFHAVLELEKGRKMWVLTSDKWQEPTSENARSQAFILRDIRLWECF
jgi:glycosyltransferase involved in cell wall biosynthesis